MSDDANTSDLERIAREAAERAVAAGAVGRSKNREGDPMTAAQRSLRDGAIMAALHAGRAVKDVAKDFKLTPRSVARIAETFGERRTALEKAPMEIVERMLRTYESQMERAAAMAAAFASEHPPASIAALKAEADAFERYVSLLSNMGKLPENLELFRAETELRRISLEMLEQVKRLEAGEITVVELGGFYRRLVTGPSPTWDAPPAAVRELPAGDEDGP